MSCTLCVPQPDAENSNRAAANVTPRAFARFMFFILGDALNPITRRFTHRSTAWLHVLEPPHNPANWCRSLRIIRSDPIRWRSIGGAMKRRWAVVGIAVAIAVIALW